jgi:hypothetical protein
LFFISFFSFFYRVPWPKKIKGFVFILKKKKIIIQSQRHKRKRSAFGSAVLLTGIFFSICFHTLIGLNGSVKVSTKITKKKKIMICPQDQKLHVLRRKEQETSKAVVPFRDIDGDINAAGLYMLSQPPKNNQYPDFLRCVCAVRQLAFNDTGSDYANYPCHHVLRMPSRLNRRHSLDGFMDIVDGLLVHTCPKNLPKSLTISFGNSPRNLECGDLWVRVDPETFEPIDDAAIQRGKGVFRLEFPRNLFLGAGCVDCFSPSEIFFEDDGTLNAKDMAVTGLVLSGAFMSKRVDFDRRYPCEGKFKHLSTMRKDGITGWTDQDRP